MMLETFGQSSRDRVEMIEHDFDCDWCGSEPGVPCVVYGTHRRATYTHASRNYAALAKVRAFERGFIVALVHAGGAA